MMTKITRLIKSFIIKLTTSTKRFPEPLLFAVAAVVTAILINHSNFSYSDPLREPLNRITMVLALGVPLFLSIRVIIERITLKISNKLLLFLSGILVLIGYYLFALKELDTISIIRYSAVSISLYVAFTFIPYLIKRDKYELYVVKLLTNLFITYLYSIVLYLGLIAMLYTVDQLFAVNVSSKLYFDIFLIVAGVFAPAYFLADIPSRDEELLIEDYPKVLRVLLQFIVMPLLVAYSTILYVYFGKILITREWPQGMVSHLVLWFSIISAIIIFFVYQLRDKNQWTKLFAQHFPKWVLPLLMMMFVAIGIRVKAYGITENRYFVIIVGLWVLGSMMYLSFAKKKSNIVLAISVAIIAIVSVFGPLSAFTLSRYSQNNRFEALLRQNDMLQSGAIVKPAEQLPEKTKQEISSIVSYFSYKHKLNQLDYLPEDFTLEKMEELFGFRLYDGIDNQRKYFYMYASDNQSIMNINDYDLYSYLSFYRNSDIRAIGQGGEYSVKFNQSNDMLELMKGTEIIYTKNMTEIADSLYKYSGKQNLTMEELMVEDIQQDMKVLYLFKNISGFENGGVLKVESAEFNIFIKLP